MAAVDFEHQFELLGAVMSGLASAIDELACADLTSLSDTAVCAEVIELRTAINALEGQWLRRVQAMDARAAYAADGGLSTASWLRGFCRPPATPAVR